MKKQIFLGSSVETRSQMEEIGEWIESQGHLPRLWTDNDIFRLGHSTLDSLHQVARQVDGALFIFGGEDEKWYRGNRVRTARDNVLIEYGLFSGVLGRAATAIVTTGTSDLASDVAGENYACLQQKVSAKNKIREWLNGFSTRHQRPHIARLHGNFWSYHFTQEQGKTFWRTGLLSLESSGASDEVVGEMGLLHADRKASEVYAVDGFTRDGKLVLLLKHMSGQEPTIVRIFPSGGAGYSKTFAGLSFHVNYDQQPAISPAILSHEALMGFETPGFVEDPASIEALSIKWRALLGATRVTIPHT